MKKLKWFKRVISGALAFATYDSNGNLVLNESPNGFVHKYYYGKLPK